MAARACISFYRRIYLNQKLQNVLVQARMILLAFIGGI